MMKLLSYNMWGRFGPYEKRWEMAARVLPKFNVDVLCFQESAYPEGLESVAKATGLSIAVQDSYSTGLSILTRFPFRQSQVIQYECKSPVETYVRKYVSTSIVNSKKTFHITNTHLSWKPGDDATREKQAQELAASVKEKAMPFLLCGDFNSEIGSTPVKALTDASMSDLMEGAPDAKRPTWDNENPYIQSHRLRFPDRRIDLVFANEEFLKEYEVLKAQIVLKEPIEDGMHISDHYGVYFEFGGR